MIHAYIANASLCNIPFLFLCFLCHPYIFTIFVENFYCSLVYRSRDGAIYTHITSALSLLWLYIYHDEPKHRSIVMCMIKFHYATFAWLALSYDYCLALLLFPDVPITAAGTAIDPYVLYTFIYNFILSF